MRYMELSADSTQAYLTGISGNSIYNCFLMIAQVSDWSILNAKRLEYSSGRYYIGKMPTLTYDATYLYYAAAFHFTTGTIGRELSIHRISLTTYALVGNQLEFNVGTTYSGHEMVLHSSKLVISYHLDTNTATIIQISTTNFTNIYNRLVLTYGSTWNIEKHWLIKTGVQIYVTTGIYTSSDNNGQWFTHLIKDVTGFQWNGGCSSLQSTEIGYSSSIYNIASGGINNLMTTLWQSYTPSVKVVNVAGEFSQFYTNVQYLRGYYYGSTADLKFSRGACSPVAAPGNITLQNYTGTIQPYSAFVVNNYSTNISLSAFTQCQGYPLTYSAQVNGTTLPSFLTYYPTLNILKVSPSSNSYVGVHSVTITAQNTYLNTLTNSSTFLLEIIRNIPPQLKQDYLPSYQMFAHHNWTNIFSLDYNLEGEPSFMDAKLYFNVNDTAVGAISWFTVDNTTLSDSIIVKFTNPPQPPLADVFTIYKIQISIWDYFTVLTPNLYNITMNLTYNYAPTMNIPLLNTTIPDSRIPWPYNYTFWYQNFTDAEGDNIIIDCMTTRTTTAPLNDKTWMMNANSNISGNITLYGTPPLDNQAAGTYTYSCKVYDIYDAAPNIYDFPVVILPKQVVTITGNPGTQFTMLPTPLIIILSSLNIDPEVQAYTRTFYVNGTLYDSTALSSWLQWDPVAQNITLTPYDNSQGGNHTFSIAYDNGIAVKTYINFTTELKQNWPLVPLKTISTIYTIVGNSFTLTFNLTDLFADPENLPFNGYVRVQNSGNNLLYFVTSNSSVNYILTIEGFAQLPTIGSYDMECVGVDTGPWETPIAFMFVVKRYYLLSSECMYPCMDGTFMEQVQQICDLCPSECSICTGKNNTNQCQKCHGGYFQLNQGCYSVCPDGYWGDTTDYKCKVCHEYCAVCQGPRTTQCTQCNEAYNYNEFGVLTKTGYLLQGTECKVPKCPDGYYFSWFAGSVANGVCIPCNERCKKCIGATDKDCIACQQGMLLNTEVHNCTKCEELYPYGGYFTNEDKECEDKCGDGVLINKGCDDGNSISGDGCSSLCTLEFGYVCQNPGFLCRENIEPLFTITQATMKQEFFIEFSEPINVLNETAISPSNMMVNIKGTQEEYVYNWRIIAEVKNPLVPNRNITKFRIILNDIKTSLEGTENVIITFKDYSLIQDLANNTLKNNSQSQLSPYPYVYVSASEASAANGSGSSLKYTFMSVFSFNIALKLLMNGSMQYLWGLVHALQVFNYLLFMNIDLPPNIQSFSAYLKVASGDIEELNQYIPDASAFLIDVDAINETLDYEKLSNKFQEYEVPPYFIMGYGQKLTIWGVMFALILPLSYIFHKLCKKVKFWEEMVGSFFFNAPLRTFVEMYIEIVLQVLVNTQFIKFRNYSQAMATFLALIFGAATVLLPFITMTVIYHNRKQVRKNSWRKSFGMLTDDCKSRSILQLYYIPAFMFQRLVICGIIVFIYNYPLMQCVGVIACNLGMMAFLIVVKPFKEENQQTTTVVDEMVIMLCVCLFAVIYMKDMAQEEKKSYGWGIVILILFSVAKNFAVVIYFSFYKLRKQMKEMFEADDDQLDSPHTSDGQNSDTVDDVKTEEVQEEMEEQKIQNEYNQILFQNQQVRMNSGSLNQKNHPQIQNQQLQHFTTDQGYPDNAPSNQFLQVPNQFVPQKGKLPAVREIPFMKENIDL